MGTVIGAVGAVVALALLLWLALTYNRLVRLRNRLQEAWAGIDVQLQRRADLVPTLVDTVEGYRLHERDVLVHVAETRSRLVDASGPADSGRADDALEGALRSLFAVAEGYPELKASSNFLALQRELATLEEDISFARRYYNALVEDLNTAVQTFPTLLIARALGFEVAEYFKASGDDRAVPQAAFGS